MRKQIIFFAALVMVVGGYLLGREYYESIVLPTYNNHHLRPITAEEFTYKQYHLGPTSTVVCGEARYELDRRCSLAGGGMMAPFFVGEAEKRYGCFAAGSAADAGKPCTSDDMCEGLCSSYDWATKQRTGVTTCTNFKKPLFASQEDIPVWSDKCGAG